MVFVDGIVLTRKYPVNSLKVLCGVRHLAYREPGDIDRDGKVVVETEVVGEHFKTAWIQGSHDSKVQLRSDGTTLSLKGNPGRFGRADNLFNHDLAYTLRSANMIAGGQGFPIDAFTPGQRDPYTQSQLAAMDLKAGDPLPESPWTGARVWSIHVTQNYATGSPENAKAVIDWLNTQSVARVKKARLGLSTIVWGDIKYCQTEAYVKADEMLAHCKGKQAKAAMRLTPAFLYAEKNGIIRFEVKCAKDFLKHRNLTFLGNWDMGTVHALFKEKTEVLNRLAVSEAMDDADLIEHLPKAVRVHAAAWLSGVDVARHMSRRTFFRHAKVLRDYGLDIAEPRNLTVIRPKMREINVTIAEMPTWYCLSAA